LYGKFHALIVQLLDAESVNAELRTADFAKLNKLRDNAFCDVYGNCKTDTNRAARGREDLRIDADHPAVFIKKRTAGIARVDRCVGLNRRVDGAIVACPDRTL